MFTFYQIVNQLLYFVLIFILIFAVVMFSLWHIELIVLCN